MIALLLLGIIPGTNLQIDFASWLRGTALLAVLVLLYRAQKKQLLAGVIIALTIRRATSRSDEFAARFTAAVQ